VHVGDELPLRVRQLRPAAHPQTKARPHRAFGEGIMLGAMEGNALGASEGIVLGASEGDAGRL